MMYSPLIAVHIAAGTIALLAGVAALIYRKGSRPHRKSGNVFFYAMLAMAGTGALVASFEPAMLSVLSGFLTLYLVSTAWMTVKHKAGTISRFDYAAALFILATSIAYFIYGTDVANSESGFRDGFDHTPYYVFGSIAAACFLLDVRLIVVGGIAGAHRLARHLWRMCFGMWIAVTSLFLGQEQIFPDAVRESGALNIPVLALLLLMFFWLVRVYVSKQYKTRSPAHSFDQKRILE